MRHSCLWFLGALSLMLVMGCDSGDGDSGPVPGSGTVETVCQGQDDCGDGSACVHRWGASFCQLNCSLDADICGAEASCTGVGAVSMSVNVCQPDPATLTDLAEFPPEEPPTLPCSTDEDCQQFSDIAICVTYKGISDCTIPCTKPEDCKMSAQVMGMTINFLECSANAGALNACLPNPICEEDPLNVACFVSILGEPTEEDFPAFDPFAAD